ncbi:histidine kinase [Chitinophaga sancti]|uniref:Histidine kinase n=1 Tax=Chitinophaga sancti TaxID=1004 RepID=A0A1K1QVU0_9BACT|nr:hypothetical protein [Chitinophaga sancti]WQD61983.1 hypothetical protein U0033_29275 [Chitinophaga sancti]WQG92448.1 hypothetical protein SR876_13110 [Chitinophaga sancti]SFW63804.1 hypothetical protein SAMN05661012_03119 [Chitinophaga sancti]
MKTSVSVQNFLEDNRLIEDIFHELKSIVASILSSVELIALYDGKQVEGRITRQTEAIKSQVIELDFQLQNVRIVQYMLNKRFAFNRKQTSLHLFLNQLIRDEPYDKVLQPVTELPAVKKVIDAYIDEFVIRQLVLNLYFWMNRHSTSHQLPKLLFSFEESYFEIRGNFYANYFRDTDNELLNQPVCYLMSYMAALHEGSFDLVMEPGKNVNVVVRIPYKAGGLR